MGAALHPPMERPQAPSLRREKATTADKNGCGAIHILSRSDFNDYRATLSSCDRRGGQGRTQARRRPHQRRSVQKQKSEFPARGKFLLRAEGLALACFA